MSCDVSYRGSGGGYPASVLNLRHDHLKVSKDSYEKTLDPR